MVSVTSMPSPSSVFAAYASASASIVLVKTMFNQFIPPQIQNYVVSAIRSYFKPQSPLLTLLIEEKSGMTQNLIYDAAELYLCTKIIPNAERLKISKSPKQSDLTIKFAQCEKIEDSFEGIDLIWRFVQEEARQSSGPEGNNIVTRSEKRLFELSFHKQFKDRVLESYIPFVENRAKAIRDEKRVVKLHTLGGRNSGYWDSNINWDWVNLEHPSNFQTLAIDPDLKKAIIEDLDSFVERKEYYKRVGKAWKRGYLLYGPPGTGKSSLIAAMANYLKFDVYDFQLKGMTSDSDLRRLLLATGNRSILVIEDIDCSVDLPDRHILPPGSKSKRDVQFTLSGLLNFIDGLWSSCGDERIIIFTTNNKEKLDPALLRPGRMDMHIHMSYCTNHGFKILASNYLGINGGHWLFGQIEDLIGQTKVSPAEIAEELMKSNEADVSLRGVVNLLKRKRIESLESKSTTELVTHEEVEVLSEGKRQKIADCGDKEVVANGVLLE